MWGAVMGPSRRRAYCAILLCAMHTGRAFPTSAPPLRFLPVRPAPDEIATSSEKAVALSTIGYGTYRIGRTEEHEATLREALLQGINVIDTSANYGDGEAEEAIGVVLRDLIEAGSVARDSVLLVSKVGYIQGQNLARYESGEVVTPETVHYGQGIKHCIHPDFIHDQLTRSLQRLQQQYLDVYLLHNPEYYLTFSVRDDASPQEVKEHQQEMLRRVFLAFVALETEVQKTGRLRSYGISSNSFSLPADHVHFLPYEGLLDLASKAAAEVAGTPTAKHSFTTIQLPANLVEQEGLKGAAVWARKSGLAVLINRPINAFNDRGAYRLADYGQEEEGEGSSRKEDLLAYLQAQGPSLAPLVSAVEAVDDVASGIPDIFTYEAMVGRRLVPMLRKGISDAGGVDQACVAKLQAFLDSCETAARRRTGESVRRHLDLQVPPGRSLQDYAISFLLDQPAVTTVLLGAKRPSYVKDAVELTTRYPPKLKMVSQADGK